jgi:hypothetical protein
MKDGIEVRLVEIFNKIENSVLDNFQGKRSNFGLKQDVIDLKYDVVKLLLEATHKDKDPFCFDLFVERQKKSSPFLQRDVLVTDEVVQQ